MKRLYYAALTYLTLALAAGLSYREYTKAQHFTGDSQLSVMHTHLLALGMLVFLTVLALDKLFALSQTRLFDLFFWFYNVGLGITVTMMAVHGTLTVRGQEVSPAVPGIAGLGHILLTIGLILLFLALGRRVLTTPAEGAATPPRALSSRPLARTCGDGGPLAGEPAVSGGVGRQLGPGHADGWGLVRPGRRARLMGWATSRG